MISLFIFSLSFFAGAEPLPGAITSVSIAKEIALAPEPMLEGFRNRSGWHKIVVSETNWYTGDTCQISIYQTAPTVERSVFAVKNAKLNQVPALGNFYWASTIEAENQDGAKMEIKCQSANGSILRTNKYFERDYCFSNRFTSWMANLMNLPDLPICERSLRKILDLIVRRKDNDDNSLQSRTAKKLLEWIRPNFDAAFLNDFFAKSETFNFQ